MSQSVLDDIRRTIDQLDEKIHDLLIKRAEAASRLTELLRKNEQPTVSPAHDNALLRRLLDRHQGPMPREAVVSLWREMIGASLAVQGGQNATVTVPDNQAGLLFWDMAKDYFGSVLPLQRVVNPLAALSMVREKEAAFAVMPWPENEAPQPWWRFLMDDSGAQPMRIIARLPLGEHKKDNGNPVNKALVVARLPFDVTEVDRSFLILQLEHRVSRARIVDKAKALGLTPLSLHTSAGGSPDYNDHLLEVTGFKAGDTTKLEKFLSLLESDMGKIVFAGGYPQPPLYDDVASPVKIASMKKSA